MTVVHKTLKFKIRINGSVPRVYKALTNVKEKALWSAPEGDAIVYKAFDFKVGGEERYQCGPVGNLHTTGIVHYEDIVKNERIVYTETIVYQKKRLATGLVTVELSPEGEKTLLYMTVQLVSYSGESVVKGFQMGYKGALALLKEHVGG